MEVPGERPSEGQPSEDSPVSPSAGDSSSQVSPSTEPLEPSRTRRRFLRGAGLVGAGMAVGVAGFAELSDVTERKLPLLPGAAAGTVGDRSTDRGRGQLRITWEVKTDAKLIALTFDDGPRPEWTNLVLQTLERYEVPATFFLVGRRVLKYREVLRGKMDRHDVGNHTWDHIDLARRSQDEAYTDLKRAHDAITEVTGKTPQLFRPPYGHFGGSAVLAADRLDYELVLWSLQMTESAYLGDPEGHARHIVSRVVPGTILLGHDIEAAGGHNRRVAIDGLPTMITMLRDQGYTFVTVTDLLRNSAALG